MEFMSFKSAMYEHLDRMLKDQTVLYVVNVDKDKMWNTYLDSFPEGTNNFYRERREYDCSCCRQFIRAFGNVVVITANLNIKTIWNFAIDDPTFSVVAKKMSKFVREHKIQDVFVTKEKSFGTDHNHEFIEGSGLRRWEHFYYELPPSFVTKSSKSESSIMGEMRASKHVLERSLDEISSDSVETVLELIAQNSLYKGEEWKAVLEKFLVMQREYDVPMMTPRKRDIYCWKMSTSVGESLSRIRNHSIGVLLTDISEGMALDDAVKRYEKIVAPTNYKRPKAIFTKKMVEKAEQTIKEMGLENSLERRFATLDDITVNNILYCNRDSAKRIAGSVFDDLKKDVGVTEKSLGKVEQISIDDFIANVLPKATYLEVLTENVQIGNLVSLIAPKNTDSKTMFKWNNNFSWAYKGNITDSMKERVKAAGGNVEGVLRFSIQWNDNGDNRNDFDAHCKQPKGDEIYYGNKRGHYSSGSLDVDIICPDKEVAVENIIFTDINKMPEGVYDFFVHVFAYRNGNSGFSAEIEFNGEIRSFEYRKPVRNGEKIPVAKVKYSRTKGFEFIESMDSTTSSKDVWNIKTNQFHPVSVLMYSPNYWDDKKGIGHKHYFFMLRDCINDSQPNGFFNEFLKDEFIPHRKVFEAIGGKMKVADTDDQLSGLGFSSTKRGSLICKVSGKFTRIVKIMF